MTRQPLARADEFDRTNEFRSEFDRKSSLTDQANSDRLFQIIKDSFMWVDIWNQWRVFDGTRWRSDRTLEIDRMAGQVPSIIFDEAASAAGKDADDLAKWGIASRKKTSQKAMIEGVKHLVAFDPDGFDQHNHLFNLLNGTLDLKTQVLRPHSPNDFLTKRVDYEYDELARHPRWVKFLIDAHGVDTERIELWQRLFGASLLGQRGFEHFVICYGTGANCKSINLGILGRLCGEYSRAASPTVFTTAKDDPQGFNIHALRAARVVTAIEVNKGSKLNLGLIKQMTGGDPISSAEKYQNAIEWIPVWHIFFATNHKPQVDGQDKGTKRRLLFLHFKNTIPDEKQRPFEEFIDYLSDELPGILNWALIGLADFLKNGLQVPRSIVMENAAFMDEQDALGDWLFARTESHPGFAQKFSDLFSDYKKFTEDLNQVPLGSRKFGYALDEKEYLSKRGSKGVKTREGIRLKSIESDSTNPQIPTEGDSTNPVSGNFHLALPTRGNFPETGVVESLKSQESQKEDVEEMPW